MLKKRSSLSELSFRELKIYYTEKGFHVNDSFKTNLNLKNEKGEYNLPAELLAYKNNIPFIFSSSRDLTKLQYQREMILGMVVY